MESDRKLCYLCKKNGKRCTGCLLIAYCGVECQRKDWKYHQKACSIKPTNVIDSLINNQSFQHIVSCILLNLNATELQSFRRTKRSWRDAIAMLWKCKASRKILNHQLQDRWLAGRACSKKTIYDRTGYTDHIAEDRGELLMGLSKGIHVLDSTNNYKLKYEIAKDKNSNVWVLHRDFVLVYMGNAFSCWDRHNQKLIDLGEFGKQIQTGEHGENVKRWNNKVKMCNDKPVDIKMFGDVGFIVYESNLVIKFKVHSLYPEQNLNLDELNNAETKFVFEHVETFEQLLKVQRMDGQQLMLFNYKTDAPNPNITLILTDSNTPSVSAYSDDKTLVYVVLDTDQLLVWHLEKKKAMYAIEGVEDLLDVCRDPSFEYVVLSRVYYHTTEEELEEVYGNGDRYMSEGWMNLPHLQIWSEQKCCRTLLVPGLERAKINPQILAVAINPIVMEPSKRVKGEIFLWNTRQLVDKKAFPLLGLVSIKRISMDEVESMLTSMLFLADRFIWCEVLNPGAALNNKSKYKECRARLKEIHFWHS